MSDPTPSGDVQWAGMTVNSMCQLYPRALVLEGMYRDYFQRHFGQAAYIENPALQELIWLPTDASSIVIEIIEKWDPTKTNRRPAIIIKENTFTNRKVGFGNKLQLQPGDPSGNPHFSTFWAGSHTLFALGTTGAQAKILGREIQREITQYANELIRGLTLEQLDVMEIGGLVKVEEVDDAFCCPITITCTYNERWTVRMQAPRLKRISLSRIIG